MKNRFFRIASAIVFLVVVFLGWKYPILAYCMFINVIVGLIYSQVRGGRSACGQFCPRGIFYGFLPKKKRPLPRILLKKPFNLITFAIFITLVIVMSPSNYKEWGTTLYFLIIATTVIGVTGAAIFNRFFWCSICPMGRIYKHIGAKKNYLEISNDCVSCKKCEKECPFQFSIYQSKAQHQFTDDHCLKCGRCVSVCPKDALNFKWTKGK